MSIELFWPSLFCIFLSIKSSFKPYLRPSLFFFSFYQAGSFLNITTPLFFSLNLTFSFILLYLIFTLFFGKLPLAKLLLISSFYRPYSYLIQFISYSLVITFFAPLIFSHLKVILPRDGVDLRNLTALSPSFSNLSHSLYLLLFAFLFSSSLFIWRQRSFTNHFPSIYALNIVKYVNYAWIFNVVLSFCQLFANLQFLTYNLSWFIHNQPSELIDSQANYSLFRISGSFSEPSLLSSAMIFFIIFYINLDISSIEKFLKVGFSTVILFLSAASTGLFSLLIIASIYLLFNITTNTRYLKSGLLIILLLFFTSLVFSFLYYSFDLFSFISNAYSQKLLTLSYENRTFSDIHSISLLIDSYFIGVGISSTDSSSFLISLLASVGILGSLLFIRFLVSILKPLDTSTIEFDPFYISTFNSLKLGFLGMLLTAILSNSNLLYPPIWICMFLIFEMKLIYDLYLNAEVF